MKSHSPIPSRARARKQCSAFTLVELLVLVGVIFVLALIQFTALARAKGHTTRAQCAGNLKEFAAGLHMFAADNNGTLPDNQNVGFWAWDIRATVGTYIEQTGCEWQRMYCPALTPPYTEADFYDLYTLTPSRRVLGYALSLTNTPTVAAINQNGSLTPPRIEVAPGVFQRQPASERVLIADLVISAPGQNNPARVDTYNFTSIIGGFRLAHRTSHLGSDRPRQMPAGGNLAMLDGHVEWRDFEIMVPRTVGSGSPVFWW